MTKDKLNTIVLIILTIGVWVIVLQNAGYIDTRADVYVVGGRIDANITGDVGVDGTIDVNISEINGHKNAFYQDADGDFMLLPVARR